MKQLLLILVFLSSLFSNNDFLSPNEAFKVNIFEKQDSLNVNINLDETIYLYDDKLKVLLNKKDITKKVLFHKPVNYHDFIVHFGTLKMGINKDFIKNNINSSNYELIVKYQGCSKKGLCYAPMEKSYKGSLNATVPTKDVKVDVQVDETTGISNILKNWVNLLTSI